MKSQLEAYLKIALGQVRRRLEERKPQEYTQSTVSLRMLEELIKEQMPHENVDRAASKAR